MSAYSDSKMAADEDERNLILSEMRFEAAKESFHEYDDYYESDYYEEGDED